MVTIYFNGRNWVETEIPGAQTWTFKSELAYRSWQHAQENRRRWSEARTREREAARRNAPTPLELLQILVQHTWG
jgi:hypothetical protein